MSSISIASPVNFTDAELASIVANASFLWERLDSERFTVDNEQAKELEIDRRLNRWCQIAAQDNWDTLHKRLQWEGLDFTTVRPLLGTVQFTANHPLPEWAEMLRQIIQMATAYKPASDSYLPTDPENPIPFEDILLPAIPVARQQLLICLSCEQLRENIIPLSLLSETAYQALERSLLQRLARLCTKTLDFEFSLVRSFGQNLLNLLGVERQDNTSQTHYAQFVHRFLQDGLLSFFQKYPVLGRLVATTVNFWVEFTAEFLQRLARDRTDVQRVFGSTTVLSRQNKVVAIQTSLSDPHQRGRTVILLTFASGLKLVYKPKELGLEAAFNQFLNWCNQQHQHLDFKIIQVLNREGYGWVEYVEHQPCVDKAAAERFYQRAGMLLCVLYALRGTDCHYENLIASGEHPVLIDTETLLHHEANLMENSLTFQEFEESASQQLWDSVLRTGLLPRWGFSADRQVAYDISGLGSTDPQQLPKKVARWQAINTDNMHLRYESAMLPIKKNVPYWGDRALSPNDYQIQITIGFKQMYRFLMVNHGLLAPESPIAAMANLQARFIFRATRIYDTLLQKTWTPDYLKHGVDYSIELDRLSCAFLAAQEKPIALPILRAELRAIEQLDIPFFVASTSSDRLSVVGHPPISHYFKQPSYQDVLNRLQTLNETDLDRQVTIVQGSFSAKVAQSQPSTRASESWEVESLPLLNSEQLIEEARKIAAELETRAILDPNGSVNWIGLGFELKAEQFQLQVLNDSLYDGRCGVALFLAALCQVDGNSRLGNLALQTLHSLRQQIKTLDPISQQRTARITGIGGAIGLGSIIYALVKVSQFLGDETLLQDAQALSDWVTPELIAADKHLDIIHGSAGAMLGLLSLYKVTETATVLEKAIACGQHLLTHQLSHVSASKAWQTSGETPLTGFSHGAAGISYALLRLYAVTQDRNYLNAALEGIEYERSVFSKIDANWPDLRGSRQIGQPIFLTQWCHGAAGIGLGRLGSLEITNISEIESEIEIALQTTLRHALQVTDCICCGNMGRVEVLLVGAQRCSRSDWYQAAFQNASKVMDRAKRTGAYQLFPNLPNSVFNPGFFQGTAGIGYQLLRLAQPEQFPSILLWE